MAKVNPGQKRYPSELKERATKMVLDLRAQSSPTVVSQFSTAEARRSIDAARRSAVVERARSKRALSSSLVQS
jgi:hypothetical protein